MPVDRPTAFSRNHALLACLAAWVFGLATGVVVGRTNAGRRHPDRAAPVSAPVEPAAIAEPAPSPSTGVWNSPMNMSYTRSCPAVVIEGMQVTDGPMRSVVMKLKLTNDTPDRTCRLPRDHAFLRDGDGNTYYHDGSDVEVSSFGVKRTSLTFSVPSAVDIVQFALPDEGAGMRAHDFDLVPPKAGGRR